MNFTLDNGTPKTRVEAVKLVTYRLATPMLSIQARHRAAVKVTAPDSGHWGYTISALVREAWVEAVIYQSQINQITR